VLWSEQQADLLRRLAAGERVKLAGLRYDAEAVLGGFLPPLSPPRQGRI
jgi:hypothetical protein